jgi:capsular polysaccharide biosynthesis protein
VLQNEAELAAMFESVGFETVEPESLSFEEQITWFSGAEQVVFLGGSGIYNTVFCAPGTRVVTIESSDKFVGLHLNLLASLGFRYGVVFGKEDPTDTSEAHRRWTVDVPRVHDAILDFFHSA